MRMRFSSLSGIIAARKELFMILTLMCARSHDATETGNVATMQISLYNSAYKVCKSLPLKMFSKDGKRTQCFAFSFFSFNFSK